MRRKTVRIKEWKKLEHSFKIFLCSSPAGYHWEICNARRIPVIRQIDPPCLTEDDAGKNLMNFLMEFKR